MRILFCILLFAVADSQVHAQYVLRGIVAERGSHKPLAGASLFLPELHLATATDSLGKFSIHLNLNARTVLQVTHIGYENFFRSIDAQTELLAIEMVPSVIQMKEVAIIGSTMQAPDETSHSTTQLSASGIINSGALSISDAVARSPGASQLTTGVGISKPVIRGLSGNRIQVNVNGLRFDNQQWQDEHGLGLSDIGVDRIEIIKGPSSLLYGSDALGGVLNIIDEKPAPLNSTARDLTAKVFSNTYGLSLNYGSKTTKNNRWKTVRLGFDNHADYSDGHNDRVLNSRFASYNLKASWGKTKAHGVRVSTLSASFSEFGFVFDSLSRKGRDGRLSRSYDGPHHLVGFIQGGHEQTFSRGSTKFKINSGITTNLRMEDEGGGGISLSMLLNTASINALASRPLGAFSEWKYGVSAMIQTNTNFGGRIIIPDAITGEGGIFSLYKFNRNKWLLEAGLRYDRKFIGTFATASLNVVGNQSPTEEVLPFNRSYNAMNSSVGLVYRVTSELSFKGNASTGYRPGNLAELSSNGLHEGSLRWEIGLPDARLERNLNLEGSINYSSPRLSSSVSIYRNRFSNFFYLAPTGQEYFGFFVYHFEQSDATLQGGEISATWNALGKWLEFASSYSFISARKDGGSSLPFIPANKFSADVSVHGESLGRIAGPVVRMGGVYVFDQNHPAAFETPTASYFLLNASASGNMHNTSLTLALTNLLNRYYYDHLSRFKYYGIGNMGRMIVLTLNHKF